MPTAFQPAIYPAVPPASHRFQLAIPPAVLPSPRHSNPRFLLQFAPRLVLQNPLFTSHLKPPDPSRPGTPPVFPSSAAIFQPGTSTNPNQFLPSFIFVVAIIPFNKRLLANVPLCVPVACLGLPCWSYKKLTSPLTEPLSQLWILADPNKQRAWRCPTPVFRCWRPWYVAILPSSPN